MADLGAIAEDVPFDFGTASTLATAFDNAATAVDGQAGSRSSWVTTGLTDFKGRFSEIFRTNAAVAASDATELSSRLRQVATQARYLAEEARKEQERREIARAWKERHDNRNWFEQGVDWLKGGDDPPVGPPAAEPQVEVDSPTSGHRDTPAPGSGGGGGGGTSSARPSKLRTFATSSKGANDQLRSKPSSLSSKLADFARLCRWGRLEASGVVAGFSKWLTANDADVQWAKTVADAFAAAGGEGNVSTLSNSAINAALHAAGIDVNRKDLTIDPPQTYGNPPTTGYANDPVNTSTGNFLENESDLGFPGAAGLLGLGRCYNSFDSSAGAFGIGWSSVAEAGLSFDSDEGQAHLRLPDGRQLVFPRLGDGWDRAVGESAWLTSSDVDGQQRLRISGTDGSWWSCAADGTLLAYGIGPESGSNLVRLERDRAGRLIRLTHGRGQAIELSWDEVGGADRIVRVASSDGRVVDYAYDADARLTGANGPLGTRTYRWADSGQQSLIAAVIDADGVVEAENVYDEQRRVIKQRSPFGRTTRFVYLPGRVTVVSDEDGSRSNTWIADDRGRLIGVVDADERRQSTSYDRYGNPVLLTERDGSTTVHEYDARGRRIRTVTPSGADLTWGYDDLDRVITVVTESGAVTEFGYQGEQRNPSTVIDPEGGITRLRWESGLLREVIDPTEVVLRYDYDERGDLVATTDADGNCARLERDAVGRVTAAITPSGRRTTYAYDPDSGLLAIRVNPDGGTWRYEYTTGGRLTATVDPMGARTSVEHGTHGEETRTIDPLGRAVTRRLDDLGNLAAVELPDGSTWRFTHDALSRLTTTTDPTGAVWRREYDATGSLVATLDPTGGRRGVALDTGSGQVAVDDGDVSVVAGFDPLGRATSLGQPDGSAALLTYDRCGRPAESLDAEGALTTYRRDAGGRVVATTGPTGAVTRYEYDRCGRLSAGIDPLGGRTTIAYDADGQAVRQTLPTGEVATSEFDLCGRVVSHHRPGVGTLRYVYDLCGRVIETRDPRTGRRVFSYDAAGQLIAVTDSNGGITRYGYDAVGRAVEITNPLGGVTRREFDAMNRCVAETDPLGRTTQAGYDPAGRLVWQQNPDGRRLSWTYDAAGRPASMAVDGRTVTALTRDLRRRTVRIEDRTGDRPTEHELEWNGRGQLLRRTRDGRSVTWSYDTAGRRTSMTTPDGQTTRYGWDAADRLAWVEHPLLGRAAFDRDASGRLISAVAGGLIQSWEHRDGFVVAHTLTDSDGASRTAIERDTDGRVVRIRRDDNGSSVVTDYGYDGACQLVEARTRREAGTDTLARWRYDAGGRLVTEAVDEATINHVYDLAGQLLTTVGADGRRLSYDYDGNGRRTRVSNERGVIREYTWNPTGYLTGVTEHDNDRVRRTRVHADALGELAEVDGTPIFWDTAAYAGAPVLVGDTPVLAAGPVTGVDTGWTAPGWRTSRGTDADPWATPTTDTRRVGDGALGIGAAGELSVGGLEWLGARVYDPASRGFLSTDPLDPITGAGWAANPYAYAGNDPLHALDPTGLRPVTDAELQGYRDSSGLGGALNSAWNATTDWMSKNWEYVVGGAAIIAGGVLMATGVGGPVGMMLISAGADTIIQKATTGSVNWGEVGVSFVAGGIGGGFAAAKLGVTGLKGAMVAGAVSGAAGGAGMGAYQYGTGPGPHTIGGYLGATASGGTTGAIFGSLGGAAGHGIVTGGTKLLDSVHPAPLPQQVIVDTNAVFNRPGVINALNDGEVPVVTQTTRAEINNLVAGGRMKQPRFATELDTIPDVMDIHTRINIRGEMAAAKPNQRGLFGDGSIAATAINTGNPVITSDKGLTDVLTNHGIEVRKP
ncbi:hypothetical protein MLP_14060 [Microlunatus phosphovorus NM-1]|uniref:Type IV secretion protein Rhs n=1 Tax=Microlunatus phosphovorus (strain ATCC 700054 / DSM 10555 / JCM 9379 / NBRC 101784 / NCIMB 13414 / VKM Ac-1990 / NM-1) TaxID=1032480 RepID=F5XQC0_MICPN|nr:DUF6531 domain-containing protein [Microlunatus phosphovorus]BAK34420.1 hypothetical protein MLP_14060 [Microlunatus phosphovorus NM-1]